MEALDALMDTVAIAIADLYLWVVEGDAVRPMTVIVLTGLLGLTLYFAQFMGDPPPPQTGPPPVQQNVNVQGLASMVMVGVLIGGIGAALLAVLLIVYLIL